MKKLTYILILVAVLFLSACANVSISYSLTEDHAASVTYDIHFDESGDEVNHYLSEVQDYWDRQNFVTTLDRDAGALNGTLSGQYDSSIKAAAGFADIVTLDNAMLYDVVFEHSPSFEEDRYSLSACISLADVIRQSQAQDIPADRIESFKSKAAEGIYTISISLPGEVVSHNADRTQGNVCTWDLAYGEQTILELQTLLVNTENLAYRSSLNDRLMNTQTLLLICGCVGGISLLIVLLSVFVRRRRRRRASIVRAKRFE